MDEQQGASLDGDHTPQPPSDDFDCRVWSSLISAQNAEAMQAPWKSAEKIQLCFDVPSSNLDKESECEVIGSNLNGRSTAPNWPRELCDLDAKYSEGGEVYITMKTIEACALLSFRCQEVHTGIGLATFSKFVGPWSGPHNVPLDEVHRVFPHDVRILLLDDRSSVRERGYRAEIAQQLIACERGYGAMIAQGLIWHMEQLNIRFPDKFLQNLSHDHIKCLSTLVQCIKTSKRFCKPSPEMDQLVKDPNKFKLDKEFVDKYAGAPLPWGDDLIAMIAYLRTYSRQKYDDDDNPIGKERWHETVERYVNGAFFILKKHELGVEGIMNVLDYMEKHPEKISGNEPLPTLDELIAHNPAVDGIWRDNATTQRCAQAMYELNHDLQMSPSGRGIWGLGTPIIELRELYGAINSCAFTSTQKFADPDVDLYEKLFPFGFLMSASMLGIGVGFDAMGAKDIKQGKGMKLFEPGHFTVTYVVPDDRQGWIMAMLLLLCSYFEPGMPRIEYDYSKIRPKGKFLRVFGGVSGGPQCLREMLNEIRIQLSRYAANVPHMMTVTLTGNIQNLIGVCVMSGNNRRSSEIFFGEDGDDEFVDLKDYEKNPDRAAFGWASNNSVICQVGQEYDHLVRSIEKTGEPGFFWRQNAREYGRMGDPKNFKDMRVMGGNPCLEQSLEPGELCVLADMHMSRIHTMETFMRTVLFTYMLAKITSIGETQWPETNEVIKRNRRIGVGQTGIMQFIAREGEKLLEKQFACPRERKRIVTKLGKRVLRRFCNRGYAFIDLVDKYISNLWNVAKSIKTTTVKPSGTVALLSKSSPGVHPPHAQIYCRRITLDINDELLPILRDADHYIEEAEQALRIEMEAEEQGVLIADKESYGPHSTWSAEGEAIIDRYLLIQQQDNEMKQGCYKYFYDKKRMEFVQQNPNSFKVGVLVEHMADIRSLDDVSAEDQIKMAVFMQKYWSNNQVSCTVTFDPTTELRLIPGLLKKYDNKLKGISFLAKVETQYRQLPYETLTADSELYKRLKSRTKQTQFERIYLSKKDVHSVKYCDGDSCELGGNRGSMLSSSNAGPLLLTPNHDSY